MEVVEVEFKAQRKEVFVNARSLYLKPDNYCIVEADRGEDMGVIVSIHEENPDEIEGDIKEILRHATEEDMEKHQANREKEEEALELCVERVEEHELPMKLVDVEYQFDGNKITFYFTSEGRVDFRDLVKDLAAVFRTRIDMRQIGVRDEAKRCDGLGMCGRRLCCATFLKDFEPVTLKMAKEQNLPLTPSKISGACGRLMCCLTYELDYYRDLRRGVPKVGSRITFFGNDYTVTKLDIFREVLVLSDQAGEKEEILLKEFKKGMKNDKGSREIAGDGGKTG